MESILQEINQIVQNSQSVVKADRDAATKYFENLKLNGQSTQALLHYSSISDGSVSDNNRLIAIIQLKNILKKVYGCTLQYQNYNDQKGNQTQTEEVLPQDDPSNLLDNEGRQILQAQLFDLMVQSIQQQKTKLTSIYQEIISIMARRNVQSEWPELLPKLILTLQQSQDLQIIRAVFECVKKICKKYRFMFRSDQLYLEMNYVIENFSQHLINSLRNCINAAQQPDAQQNEQLIQNLYGVMNSILHIIESILSQEELPDYYEEQLPTITEACVFILNQDYPKFQKVPDQIIKARGKVVSLTIKYTFKFGEYFQQYQEPMFQAIWSLVENNKVQASKQCEKLVRATIKYIGEMANLPSKKQFIQMNLMKIFDILVLPNISITQDDMDEYEDDPDAYIRNDLEESDVETRRRHVMKFVNQLSSQYQQDVQCLIEGYISTYIGEYQNNRNEQWLKKASLLNLLITSCISNYTYKNGAADLKVPEQSLFQYIEQLIMPELQEKDVDNLQLMKATCIKFVYMFRNQIPDEHALNYLGLFAQFLSSASIVNQSYAAACIEKILTKRNKLTQQPIINQNNIPQEIMMGLLGNLCNLLSEQKNLYAIRALYRVISVAKEGVQSFSKQLGELLSKFIMDTAKDENDQSPNYVYILFETTALTIKFVSSNLQEIQSLEQQLTAPLSFILENNKTELMGYTFQLFSLFLANSQVNSEMYQAITQSLIQNQSNWGKDMKYLIPSMAQYLISMICKYPDYAKQYCSQIQEILKYLMGTDVRMETVALEIVAVIFERIGIVDQQFMKDILFQVFTTMHYYKNNTKNLNIPVSITKAIHILFATIIVTFNAETLIQVCDQIQPGILFMILKSEGDKIKHCTQPTRSKKYVIVAYTNLVCEYAPKFQDNSLQNVICSLIELASRQSATSGFQLSSQHQGSAEEMLMDGAIDQTYAFQRMTHTQLQSARIDLMDALQASVPQGDVFFLKTLGSFLQSQNQSINQFICDQKVSSLLNELIQRTGVNIQ